MNDGVTRIGACNIDPTARVSLGVVIGKPFRPLLAEPDETWQAVTSVGPGAYVGYYSLVGAGSIVEAGVIVDDFSVIECGVRLGSGTLVIYRAQICNDARIGRDCVIGGFVAERSVIGDRCRVLGKLVHSQHNPCLPWDSPDAEENSAVVEDDVFIGFDALVIGAITVGAGAYVCAGALVTRDVPRKHVAYGVNKTAPYSEWPGVLSRSPFFHAGAAPRGVSERPGEDR